MYGHVITKFSRMGSLPHFLTHGSPQARFARQSSAMKTLLGKSVFAHKTFVLNLTVLPSAQTSKQQLCKMGDFQRSILILKAFLINH